MTDPIYDQTLNEFIKVAASKSHTPGGGNVSAVVAALGASMIAMVGNLTISNKNYADHHESAQAAVDRLMAIIEKLKNLTNKDIEAFDDYMKCFRMPKETDGEKKDRVDAVQAAAKKATLIPLQICETCLEAIKEADDLSKYGNLMAISDVGVGAFICEAALRACMLSVDINIPTIKDQDFVKKVKANREHLFVQAEEYKLRVLARVKEKMD